MTGTRWQRRAAGAGMLLVLALAGCSNRERMAEASAGAAGAVASPEDASLAYEHDVEIQLKASQIGPQVRRVADACQSSRFGDCAVLQVVQQGGEYPSGSIRVRIAPKGVEPLIGLAGEGGDVASRTTQAEDLAEQVADTALTQARLQKEHERLLAYQDDKSIKVADLLVVMQRLSEIEAGLEQANRDAANQRRRIDTQLLTLRFQAPSGQRSRSEIGEALRDFGSTVNTSVAFVIRAVAVLLPVTLVLGLLGWIILTLLRRRRRASASSAP